MRFALVERRVEKQLDDNAPVESTSLSETNTTTTE